MHSSRRPSRLQQLRRACRRAALWAADRRAAALGHLLRGICYGTGTGAVSLLVYWLQNRR
jgi:hypothetical protein